MKCGTTSLYDYLAQHPDIASSAEKEPKYFSSDERFARGLGWYEGLYPTAGDRRWILDGSTDCSKYPYCGDVPARMAASGGAYKLIYLVRHPLRRIESHARHAQLMRDEVNQIRSDRPDHSLDHGVSPVSLAASDYAAQIDRFRYWYDSGDMLLLTTEELERDPEALVERALDFIGLPPLASLRRPRFQNRAGERKEPIGITRLLRRAPAIYRALGALLPPAVRARGHRPIKIPGRFRLTPDEETALITSLTPSLVRLRDVYGLDAEHHWNIPLPQ